MAEGVWLAITLDNLATVTKELGDSDEARAQWNEVAALCPASTILVPPR